MKGVEVLNTVRKIKIIIKNDNPALKNQQYKFISNSQHAQYLGLNRCMGYLASGFYLNGMNAESREFKKLLKTINNQGSYFDGIEFGKGIDSKSLIVQRVKKDFNVALKGGLENGERGVNNYKNTFPLMTRGRDLKFIYSENNREVLINWVNNIQFKCIVGRNKSSIDLKHTLHKLVKGEYKVNQSSIYYNNKKELILVLNYDIPELKIHKSFEKGRSLGVDLGRVVPIYMSLNDKAYIKKSLGNYDDFIKVNSQFKDRERRLIKQIEESNDGQKVANKIKAMRKLKDKQYNFSKTYNHFLSKSIVNFALKNDCEYINLKGTNSNNLNKAILSNWSFEDLKEKIEYKAEKEGIKVRIVNIQYDSQRCSRCGNIVRNSKRKNNKFKCDKCGFECDFDYNTSQNIAKNIKFTNNTRKYK